MSDTATVERPDVAASSAAPPLLAIQGIRKAGQSLIGKLIIAVMFGFLIISFAVWGIGDIFRGYGRNAVATVGKKEISIEQMRTRPQFVRMTGAGIRESHVHDVRITKEAPNYRIG